MADMFYFSSGSDASSRIKYVRLSSKCHWPLGKTKPRKSPRMEEPLEVACMARFAEPVFCSNAFFPFFATPSSTLHNGANSNGIPSEDDGQPREASLQGESSRRMKDDLKAKCRTVEAHDIATAPNGLDYVNRMDRSNLLEAPFTLGAEFLEKTSFWSATERNSGLELTTVRTDVDASSRAQHPRPECDEISQEEDGRRQRIALPGDAPDGLLYFDFPKGGHRHLGRLPYQRSCDSLRSQSREADELPQTRLSNLPSSNEIGSQDSSANIYSLDITNLDGVSGGFLYNEGDYTVLEEMAQSAWAVDDLRHSNDVLDFCSSWEESDCIAESQGLPVSQTSHSLRAALARQSAGSDGPSEVSRQDTQTSSLDLQGINWAADDWIADPRDYALQMRTLARPSVYGMTFPEAEMRTASSENIDTERHYRFRHFSGAQRPTSAHYQLRHLVCSDGRDVFYANKNKIMQSSLAFPGEERAVIDLTRSHQTSLPVQVTCLATSGQAYHRYQTDSVLFAGGFDGEYAMLNFNSSEPHSEGSVTLARNGLVTHIHSFAQRNSGLLRAAFCSNDLSLRLLDARSQRFTSTFRYDTSLNCASTAPDGRLCVLGGDSPEALITDAENGVIQAKLQGHTDDIFACAWSPNGRYVATGAQDGKVLIWDPRNWSIPLASLHSSMTCARSLQFTSDSGVLVAAENEDIVRIVDTNDWTSRQDLRFFGTVTGVALVNGGDELVVGNGDRTMGGLLSWQRTYATGFDASCDCSTTETFDGKRTPEARRTRRSRKRGMRRNELVEEVFV